MAEQTVTRRVLIDGEVREVRLRKQSPEELQRQRAEARQAAQAEAQKAARKAETPKAKPEAKS